jgi:hypothetical protein
VLVNLDAALDFLEFVQERHRIWEARQEGWPQPWTDHPILATRKFTNVFRVLDYGSQFLLEELYDPELSPRDLLMRFFLYRHTGRVETWQYLQAMMGDYPTVDTLPEALYWLKQYRGDNGETRVRKGRWSGKPTTVVKPKRPVFTGAYLVYPQSDTPGTDKLDSVFQLTHRLFERGSQADVMPDFLAAETQAERFAVLRRNNGVADFMSMQVLTDWGYTTEFREDEFVVCGPGAVKGARALDPDARPAEVHRWAVHAVRNLDPLPRLNGRPPSWMDVQNCLCEFSKFVRYQAAPATEKVYVPAHPGPQPDPVLPALW